VRKLPGRIIGVSVDVHGKRALRMALATREQHIRREKATSNVCTAQALLAIVASMYAVYHGPAGVRAIAERVHGMAACLALGLKKLGVRVAHDRFFDTVRVEGTAAKVQTWLDAARARRMNLRRIDDRSIGVALDEVTSPADVDALLAILGEGAPVPSCAELAREASPALGGFERKSAYLTHEVFGAHHSETELLRYMRTLESRDLSLAHSMIPLGSCTMKLNATAEMMPITWPHFNRIHPFVPVD
jgi:glycine dehydrogenase